MIDNDCGEQIKVNSKVWYDLDFTSEKFDKCSYISKLGKDMILSAVFERLETKEKEVMIRKYFKNNQNLSIPMEYIKELIIAILNEGYNCIVPEFIYYDNELKKMGLKKVYIYDNFYKGYTGFWTRRQTENLKEVSLLIENNVLSWKKNLQQFKFYCQKVLKLIGLYLIDYNLVSGMQLNTEDIPISPNITKIRFRYLEKEGVIIFDKNSRKYKTAQTRKGMNVKNLMSMISRAEYCKKISIIDTAKFISTFYNEIWVDEEKTKDFESKLDYIVSLSLKC